MTPGKSGEQERAARPPRAITAGPVPRPDERVEHQHGTEQHRQPVRERRHVDHPADRLPGREPHRHAEAPDLVDAAVDPDQIEPQAGRLVAQREPAVE
jgi:hypothetical protein